MKQKSIYNFLLKFLSRFLQELHQELKFFKRSSWNFSRSSFWASCRSFFSDLFPWNGQDFFFLGFHQYFFRFFKAFFYIMSVFFSRIKHRGLQDRKHPKVLLGLLQIFFGILLQECIIKCIYKCWNPSRILIGNFLLGILWKFLHKIL